MTSVTTGPLRPSDVAELARIHREAFPTFFLSSLGEPFLRQFYAGFVGDAETVAIVLRDARDGRPIGAAVGPLEPAGFFSRLLRRRLIQFALAGARSAVHSPRTVPRLLRGILYRGHSSSAPGALLSSICVSPAVSGSGCGSALLRAWQEEVVSRGVSAAHLTTDADDNDGVNAFYDARGWVIRDTYITPEGRRMHLRVNDRLA